MIFLRIQANLQLRQMAKNDKNPSFTGNQMVTSLVTKDTI